jgi:hypothetical protein
METITGLFERREDAEKAVRALKDAGLDTGKIKRLSKDKEVLLSVETEAMRTEEIKEILNAAGSVDMEERQRLWKQQNPDREFFEGWNQNM